MGNDEDELWNEVKKTVKPLKNPRPVVTPVVKLRKPVVLPRVDIAPRDRLQERAVASPLPKKRLKQLRQQKVPVEGNLDLHGMTIDKAHQAVKRFLLNSYRNQLRCVEIITGKGDPLRGTGLLKREFPQWLAGPDLRLIILHYEENPTSRGGAFLVMLRRNKSAD
jgi:DNA-nicking Smr family endonuclease